MHDLGNIQRNSCCIQKALPSLVLPSFQMAPHPSLQTDWCAPHPSIRANPTKLSRRTSRPGHSLCTEIHQKAACTNLRLPRRWYLSEQQHSVRHTAPHCTTLHRTATHSNTPQPQTYLSKQPFRATIFWGSKHRLNIKMSHVLIHDSSCEP